MKPCGKNPCETLGLGPNPSLKEIRQAYRKLAMRYHPDRNKEDPGAADNFKRVQDAYESLTGKKQEESATRLWRYNARFSEDIHPFFSFLEAARIYCSTAEKKTHHE